MAFTVPDIDAEVAELRARRVVFEAHEAALRTCGATPAVEDGLDAARCLPEFCALIRSRS